MQPDIARLHLGTEDAQPAFSSFLTPQSPNRPVYTGKQLAVRDITKEFADASAELRQGQLVKDDFFTLFESVGALEIMDPKMDSGFVLPEKDAAVDNFDPLKPMLPAEMIGIMDQMICFEMAWHQGRALSQTLFTSLHLYSLLTPYFRPLSAVVFRSKTNRPAEEVDPLINEVLRAYCLGMMKSCDSVIAEVQSEHYYEEEDFVSQTFTQYLLSDYNETEIISIIQDSINVLEQQELPDDIRSAIRSRLQLRVHMLEALQPLVPGKILDKTEKWNDVFKSLEAVNATIGLGQEKPDAYSERVQRHLASNTPPIPMIKSSWEEAYLGLKRTVEDNIEAHRVATIDNPSPFNVVRFAWDFSSRKPQPSTYCRAVMQGLLFKEGKFLGKKPHLDLLLEDLRSLVMVGDPLLDPANWEVELPSDPRYQSSRKIDEFMNKALDEYINIPRMILQNRCRTRRTLNQSVAILDGLQAEAEQIDSTLHTLTHSPQSSRRFGGTSLQPLQFYPLAAWSYYHKLRVMEWSLQLGFALECHLSPELPELYRFLAFLSHTRLEHLQHIDFFLNIRQQKARDPSISAAIKSSRAFVAALTAQVTVTTELASALSVLYTLLHTLGLMPSQAHNYSTPALRHELRMKPYLPIGTPALPSHEDLAAATWFAPNIPLHSVFETATNHLNAAKSALAKLKTTDAKTGAFVGCEEAWRKEVQGWLGTCVGAGIAVAVVKKGVEGLGVTLADVTTEDVKGRLKVQEVMERRFSEEWVLPKVVGV